MSQKSNGDLNSMLWGIQHAAAAVGVEKAKRELKKVREWQKQLLLDQALNREPTAYDVKNAIDYLHGHAEIS